MVKDEEKRKILEALIYLMEPYRIEAMQRYLSEIPKNRELTRKIFTILRNYMRVIKSLRYPFRITFRRYIYIFFPIKC